MKPSAILAFTLCLTACGVARPVLESDNTKVEVKTVVRTVTDTAYIELPVIVEKVATLDTTSVLENKYAKSEASVSGGVLHHSLQTKPVREPVKVERVEVVRDSLPKTESRRHGAACHRPARCILPYYPYPKT